MSNPSCPSHAVVSVMFHLMCHIAWYCVITSHYYSTFTHSTYFTILRYMTGVWWEVQFLASACLFLFCFIIFHHIALYYVITNDLLGCKPGVVPTWVPRQTHVLFCPLPLKGTFFLSKILHNISVWGVMQNMVQYMANFHRTVISHVQIAANSFTSKGYWTLPGDSTSLQM